NAVAGRRSLHAVAEVVEDHVHAQQWLTVGGRAHEAADGLGGDRMEGSPRAPQRQRERCGRTPPGTTPYITKSAPKGAGQDRYEACEGLDGITNRKNLRSIRSTNPSCQPRRPLGELFRRGAFVRIIREDGGWIADRGRNPQRCLQGILQHIL